MSRIHRAAAHIAIAMAFATMPPAAYSQGFGLNEIGTCAIARAFANTGSPCHDGSLIYWNPAAATMLNGWDVSAGVAIIGLKGNFNADTIARRWNMDAPVKAVPNLFLTYHKAGTKPAFGLGVYVPYGLTSQWPDDFPGRFVSLMASLTTVYVQPNVAWQINRHWSIGGGPVFGFSSVQLIQAIDLSEQMAAPGLTFGQLGIPKFTEFARVKLSGTSNGIGLNLGAYGTFGHHLTAGVRFLAPITFRYGQSTAMFTQTPTNLVLGATLLPPVLVAGAKIDNLVAPLFLPPGPLVTQSVSTRIVHPAQLELGAGYSGVKNWLFSGDYAWVGWRRFDDIPLDFADTALSRTLIEGYRNTSAFRFGAEYTQPKKGWQGRAGIAGAIGAAPPETVTPLLPEQDRLYYTVGAGIPFLKKWTVDLAYMYVGSPGARGRIVERTSASQTAAELNSGVYNLWANIVSITLKARF